jgi:hypothetical protein
MNCFHKGLQVKNKERNMFTINYSICSEEQRFIIKETDYNKMNSHFRNICDSMLLL